MHDFRLAVRTLRATPVVSLVAILSLALGIGANTAIFSLVSGLLLRSLPVVDPERLAMVSTSASPASPQQYSYATFDQIRQHRDVFDGALGYTDCCGTAILNVGGENQSADRQFVSGDFFTTLGVRAFRGRLLTPADDALNAPEGPVAVVSYRLWRARLGARDDVVGARLSINRMPVTVVGVMPPTFFGVEVGRVMDVAMPYRLAAQFTSTPFDDDTLWLNIMVRLKAGLSISDGRTALRALQPQIRAGAMPAKPRPDFLQNPLTLEPAGLGASMLRQRFERPLLIIFVVVALVLVVACANVGHLLLARGIARRPELSVRVALGASRWRLVRQLLTESVLLSSLGAAIGLALAPSASRLLVAVLSTSRAPIALDLALDWRVVAFTVATTAMTTILFGVAPAFRATRVAPIEALNAHGRTASGGPAASSDSFIVAQVVLSLVLVVAAGLFVQTFQRLARVPLGFDRDRVLVVSVNAPTVGATERSQLFGRLVRAVATVPGVVAAGGSMNPPIAGGLRGDFVVSAPGTSAPPDAEPITYMDLITPGWMAAYGTGIRAGRDFDDRDTRTAPRVMLVNDAFVRRFLPGREVIGTTLGVASRASPTNEFPMGAKTIVGVVGDTVSRSLREPVQPAIYLPLAQWDWPLLQYTFNIGVRSATGSPASVARAVETALRGINDDMTFRFEPLAQQVDESLAADRLLAMLSGFFGVVALLLAGLGLYGVTAYAVARRRFEIGIRMALGAAPAGVVWLVLSRVSVLVGIGVIVGAGVSVWASKFVATLLYGLEPRDPATLVGSAITLAAVGALAGWLPARRASRIDPAEVLRDS
ncbi:MAG: ABC transporter permease [Acidobacteriia bacterium]|nr:ABC transporter permease [Terriglobia bacterium]